MVVIQKFMLRSVEIDTACHSGPHREASSSVGRQKNRLQQSMLRAFTEVFL